jgi:hypothetical protein
MLSSGPKGRGHRSDVWDSMPSVAVVSVHSCCLTIVHLASTRVGASNAVAGSGVNRVTEPEGVPLLLREVGQANRRATIARRTPHDRQGPETAGRALWGSTSICAAVPRVSTSLLAMPDII